MKTLEPPRLEERRTRDFQRELLERARAWVGSWGSDDGDFGHALLAIAARFSSEVAERLDRSGDKMRRGFLDWLGVRRDAARPARMPVVFKLTAKAEPILATAPLRMQADVQGASVAFETESAVRLLPGSLAMVVATDAGENDAIFIGPPGLTEIEPPEAAPTQWRLKSFAAPGSRTLQLDPDTGLAEGMIVAIEGWEYRITKVNKDLVTIDPAVRAEAGFGDATVVRKTSAFEPFASGALDRQFHALYLGHPDLLNIEAAGTIEVVGAQTLAEAEWHYWGKRDGAEEVDWQRLAATPSVQGVVLSKGPGAVETRDIDPVKGARWIRASTTNVRDPAPTLSVERLMLRVNCTKPWPPSCSMATALTGASAEALANTTPLVTSSPFYPLGLTPRQFDTFYLASDEAFSKKGADVQLCFTLANPSFASLSTVTRSSANPGTFLVGVGLDRSLHLFSIDSSGAITKFREPLQPPLPPDSAFGASPSSPVAVQLDAKPPWRVPIFLSANDDFFVAVAAGSTVWVWHEVAQDKTKSGWENFGALPPGAQQSAPIDGLVFLDDGPNTLLFALQGRVLARRGMAATDVWTPVPTGSVKLASIVPVLSGGALVSSPATGLVGVGTNHLLYSISHTGNCTKLGKTAGSPQASTDVRPIAIKGTATKPVVVAAENASPALRLVAVLPNDNEDVLPLTGAVVGRSLGGMLDGTEPTCIVSTETPAGNAFLTTWAPGVTTGLGAGGFESALPAGSEIGGAPTVVGRLMVIPGTRANVMVAPFDLSQRQPFSGDILTGVVLPSATRTFVRNDSVTFDAGSAASKPVLRKIDDDQHVVGSEAIYALDGDPVADVSGEVHAFLTSAPGFKGDTTSVQSDELELQRNEFGAVVNLPLVIDTGSKREAFLVTKIDDSNNPWVATLNRPHHSTTSTPSYWIPIATHGRVAPFLRPDQTKVKGSWQAALLDRVTLVFEQLEPRPQMGQVFALSGPTPTLVVLEKNWKTNPPKASTLDFLLDSTVGAWSRQLGDGVSNPALSWEYWNGGWSKLVLNREDTQHFKDTGAIEFTVPDDIAATDWAGKTHFWIRARLIGGDYGSESTTVLTETLPNGKTKQTIDRVTDGIKPPVVVHLRILYALCTEVAPTYVLTEDTGSTRDQSDANSTAGALVEAFVPLSIMLGRLLSGTAVASGEPDCPPDCACPDEPQAPARPGPPVEAVSSPRTATPATGRSLFLGFDAPLSGDTVKVLLMVEREQQHDALAPLVVQALIGNRFVPLVVQDDTRALGENGVLTLAFPDPPTATTLFGRALSWLRLAPAAGSTTWNPSLRGAYLNAVWAGATETLTRELLGSSAGEPNLTVTLARPPVLRDSLELRVSEPLGDEERQALRDACGETKVLSDDPTLPGDWVLWKRVGDPADEEPRQRVYALDEASGEIRFGDGEHGAIPPEGQNSIVAFRYQRTEPPLPDALDVPGNAVEARKQVNLVSPVAGVEAVFSADHAAGGAPAELDERVLRFGAAKLRHRERAVTMQDLEDLALESSPAVAQARAVARGRRTRLVVVMRGDDPIPTAAQKRELKRHLLAAAPPSLDQDRLDVRQPVVRYLRVLLTLRVERLDHAGAVAEEVKKRLAALLDTATGGVSTDGWPLGASPQADEIAFALVTVPRLLGLAKVDLIEVRSDGSRPWPAALAAHELARLAPDGVRFTFELVEAAA